MKKAFEYREHAEECRQMMVGAASDHQRALLENMARTWDSLAADRERRMAQSERIASLERRRKVIDSRRQQRQV